MEGRRLPRGARAQGAGTRQTPQPHKEEGSSSIGGTEAVCSSEACLAILSGQEGAQQERVWHAPVSGASH